MSTSTAPTSSDAPDLRVGVIGLGFAGTTHLDAFTALPGATVVALSGQEPARLAELAESRGVPETYADWEDLVARDDLDIVSIGVPNALHHPIAVAALRSGKHVFCEKPLATTADLAAEMVEAATAADRVLEVAYNHRRRADVAYLARYLAEEPIGRVYHSRASWLRRQGVPGIDSWFTNKAAAGGGPLIDLGSHVLDIALSLLGEPRVTHVSAVAYNELGRAGRGGSSGGGPVSSRSTHAFDVEDISVELLGSEGGVRLHVDNYNTEGTVTIYRDVAGAPTIERPAVQVPAGHHQSVIAEFLDTIRAGETAGGELRFAGHHGEYALHRSRVIDAAYASAAAGHELEVPA
jgi:predicted dehydrogenase